MSEERGAGLESGAHQVHRMVGVVSDLLSLPQRRLACCTLLHCPFPSLFESILFRAHVESRCELPGMYSGPRRKVRLIRPLGLTAC